ncbi:MAG: hypothetical protein VXZ72_01675 [Chlamydiota bacterium]|nr:hypothetical protein [Chlamydiota bacterium]
MKKIMAILPLFIMGVKGVCADSFRRLPSPLFSIGTEGLFMKREVRDKGRVLIATEGENLLGREDTRVPFLTERMLGKELTHHWSLGEVGHLFLGRWGECVVRYRGPITSSITMNVDQLAHPTNLSYHLVGSGSRDVYYSHAQQVVTRWNTRLTTLDVDYWRHMTSCLPDIFSLSWVAGIHALKLEEGLNFDFSRKILPQNAQYEVAIKNRGLGPHLGAIFEWRLSSHLTWQLFFKGSFLYNEGHRMRRFMTDFATVEHPAHEEREVLKRGNFAYGFEGGPEFEILLMDKISLSVGYPFLYMRGLVGSFDDLSLTKTTSMSATQEIFYHGLLLSAVFSF